MPTRRPSAPQPRRRADEETPVNRNNQLAPAGSGACGQSCARHALLAACGGGVGTGGTGAFASGPITGFGSIIVNDVRLRRISGAHRGRHGSRAAQRATICGLGTVVEVDSDAVRNDAATASRVRITSERIGRVDAVAPTLLTVNGLPVRFNGGTVFDESFSGGAAGVAAGAVVEVHGFATARPAKCWPRASNRAPRPPRSSSAPPSRRSTPRRAPSRSATRALRTPPASAAAMNSPPAPSSPFG